MRLALATLVLLAGIARADDDVMLQGFYWDAPQDWYGTLEKQAPDIASSGFTMVWLPPPEKGMAGRSSDGYDPYDHYDLGEFDQKGSVATRWGTRKELDSLLAALHAKHVKALADLVMNHMMGADAKETCPINGKTDWTKFDYKHAPPTGAPTWDTVEKKLGHAVTHASGEPYLFTKSFADFHPSHEHPDQKAPFHNKAFGPDLCQAHDWVKVGLELWGDWLVNSVGYDGFRVDFAKGLDPGFLPEFFRDGKKNGKFAVMEVWDSADTIAQYVNETGAHAFDFPLFFTLRDMCNDRSGGFDMRKLDGAGFTARNPLHSVTFAGNHDTDRSNPIVGDKMMAYAYILAMEGLPCVFYRDYYDRGLKAQIDPLIKIRKKLAGGKTTVLAKDPHLFVAERDGGALPGLVLVLNDDPSQKRGAWVTVKSGWAGKELADYTGHEGKATVAKDGRVQLFAPPRGYAVYSTDGVDLTAHAEEGLPPPTKLAADVAAPSSTTTTTSERVTAPPSTTPGITGAVR